MQTVVSYVQSYRDKLSVVLYVIFVVAAIIVYPAHTTEVSEARTFFNICEGGWENPAGAQGFPDETVGNFSVSSTVWGGTASAITCTMLSTSTIPAEPLTVKLHIPHVVVESSTSTVQAAALDEGGEPSVVEVVVPTSTVEFGLEPPPTENQPIIEEATSTPIAVPDVATSTEYISVEYSTDGSTWVAGGHITNTTSGEFQTTLENVGSLEHLQVRLTGSTDAPVKIYIDSVWLSIEYRSDAPVAESLVSTDTATTTIEVMAPVSMPIEEDRNISYGKPPQVLFEGPESDNPPVVIPTKEAIVLDPNATHSCELTQYRMSLGNDIPQSMNVSVLLSNFGASTSTVQVDDVADGLSFAFEDGSQKIAIQPDQLSVMLKVDITKNIEPRSFNIPIIYSLQKPDGLISNTMCQLNLIVE